MYQSEQRAQQKYQEHEPDFGFHTPEYPTPFFQSLIAQLNLCFSPRVAPLQLTQFPCCFL